MMSKRSLIIVLVVVCLAGVALSAPANRDDLNEYLFGIPKCKQCAACKWAVEQIKASGVVGQLKPRLEALCGMLGEQSKVDQCTKMVDQITGDIENKSPEEVCKEVKMC